MTAQERYDCSVDLLKEMRRELKDMEDEMEDSITTDDPEHTALVKDIKKVKVEQVKCEYSCNHSLQLSASNALMWTLACPQTDVRGWNSLHRVNHPPQPREHGDWLPRQMASADPC